MRMVRKPETIRDLREVDTAAIVRHLDQLSETVWAREDARKENRFACFANTRHIILRFIPGNRDPRESYDTVAWPLWRDLVMPVMQHATQAYRFERPAYPKAMFARLAAGCEIARHVDGPGSNLVTHKIHVPLRTNPGAVFLVDDEPFHLACGHAYEVNNIRPHAVRNDGPEDRIHFIFEAYDEAYAESEPA